MRHQMKVLALCAGLFLTLPFAHALDSRPLQVAFKYDSAASVATTYRRAERTAQKACGLNGRVLPMKRALLRSCVRPLVEDFVIATGNLELAAHHEKRTGRTIRDSQFVAP